jgi:hypothetical protein
MGPVAMKAIKNYFAIPFFLLVRPIEGYKRIKYEKQGKWSHALLFFFMLCISFTFFQQYRGFVIQDRSPRSFNLWWDITRIVIAFLLFCIANWSITSLTEGEGRFMDIMRNLAYSFFPLILVLIPVTILTNFLTIEEQPFATMIINVAVAWFVMLAFISILVTHNYSFTRTIVTIIFTVIAVLVITFLAGLFIAIIQQVQVFLSGVYYELIFRL